MNRMLLLFTYLIESTFISPQKTLWGRKPFCNLSLPEESFSHLNPASLYKDIISNTEEGAHSPAEHLGA